MDEYGQLISIIQSLKQETQQLIRENKQPPYDKILCLVETIFGLDESEKKTEVINCFNDLTGLALKRFNARANKQQKVLCTTYLKEGA